MQPVLQARFRAKGFQILGWADGGWITFFSRKPILRPDDLKARKFFVWAGDNEALGLWKSAGYTPVPLAAPDILPGLQTGLINTFNATPLAALQFQWYPLAPHMTDLRWAPLIGGTVMTQRGWNRIPEKARPAILKAAADAEVRMKADIRADDAKAVEVMKKKGLTVHPITAAHRAEWQRVFEEAYPQMMERIVPEEVFKQAMRFRDAFRAKRDSKP
jgi:TRAP-type C4-dicarboxylate transport system substrate-binding protein